MMGREFPNTMQDLIQDMLVWLATFFGVSLALICAVRWGLKRVRQRRLERLKEIEARCRVVPDELGLPLVWKTSPKSLETFDYRVGRMLQWSLPAGCLAAGAMWSMIGQDGWNWNGGACGVLAAFVSLLVLTVWMNWRRETTMPRQSRQLVLALRCWAIRISAGVECRLALEQTAKQLRRLDPEIARHLAAGAANPDGDLLQQVFHPCGSGVAERLADIVAGRTSDEPQVLLALADQLEGYYLNQVLSRTRYIEGWLKYPLVLCLVPAVNLLLFGPAIANLLEKFGTLRLPGAVRAPLQPDRAVMDE